MEEIWKSIERYENLYFVSNLGRIRNRNGLVLRQKPSNDGYIRIQLCKSGKYTAEYIHRLVALAFIPNPENKPEVNHIDGNKSNNHVDNLEWVTTRENNSHAIKLGLKPICPTVGKYGADNPCVKPIFQYDMQGNFLREWPSRADAAKFYQCQPNSISRCMNGVRKSCKGYIWKRTKE